jgi:hypothetical protein
MDYWKRGFYFEKMDIRVKLHLFQIMLPASQAIWSPEIRSFVGVWKLSCLDKFKVRQKHGFSTNLKEILSNCK